MKTKVLWIISALTLLFAGTLLVVYGSQLTYDPQIEAAAIAPPPVPTLLPTPAPWDGVPAIQPSLAGAKADEPTFTKDDVVRRFKEGKAATTKGIYGAAGYDSKTPASIVSIEFLTAKEMVARRPDLAVVSVHNDAPVCLVYHEGTFLAYGPPGQQTDHRALRLRNLQRPHRQSVWSRDRGQNEVTTLSDESVY